MASQKLGENIYKIYLWQSIGIQEMSKNIYTLQQQKGKIKFFKNSKKFDQTLHEEVKHIKRI